MDQASTALLWLNLETRPYHAAADAGWLRLTRANVTRAVYAQQLAATYGFEAPLESALAYTPNFRLRRSRMGLLAQDLLTLGLSAHEIAHLPQYQVAPFGNRLEALGWLYVTERATLLHGPVHRNIAERLRSDACAYVSYEQMTGARWHAFGRALDQAAPCTRTRAVLFDGAHAGFRALIAWMRVAQFVQPAIARAVS